MPKKGYVWSERLQKYRRPAFREWANDRQGIHLALGLGVVAVAALVTIGFALLVNALGITQGALLAAVLLGIAVEAVMTHQFLRYEEVEAKEIADDGYIDIGGYLTGQLIGFALTGAAMLAWAVAGVL